MTIAFIQEPDKHADMRFYVSEVPVVTHQRIWQYALRQTRTGKAVFAYDQREHTRLATDMLKLRYPDAELRITDQPT